MTARRGPIRAVVVYFKYPHDYGRPRPRLTILRNGQRRFFEIVQPNPRDNLGRKGRVVPYAVHDGTESKPLWVRDLDRDGEPEVLLDLFWGGQRCCLWTRLYRFDRTESRYVPANHWWGNFQDSYRLRDLDRDRRPEFVAADGRIASISDHYYSADPIQIWSYRRDELRDVTRRFPELIARDARHWWAVYLRQRQRKRFRWVREPLSAWVADEYLRGRQTQADRALEISLRRGELDLPRAEHAVNARKHVARLKLFLRRNGYVGSPTSAARD
jgi:hypothetical protein